jgi:hypothetical protein
MTVTDIATTSRKFKEAAFYDGRLDNDYFLMPVRFHRLNDQKEVLVNEVGDHLVVSAGTFSRIVQKDLDK